MACLVGLCGFEGSSNGPVLEVQPSTPTANPATRPDASIEYNDPAASIPSGPDLRFHQFLKFYGCWSSIVTGKELTAFANDGSGVLSNWVNRRYTICFVRDLSGELQPNMSQVPAAAGEHKSLASSTELTGYDDQVVSLLNHDTFVYKGDPHSALKPHWYSFGRASKTVEIEQVTNISCLREGLHLICTARGTAECKGKYLYSFSWKARFDGSG